MNIKNDLITYAVLTVVSVLLGAYVLQEFIGIPVTQLINDTAAVIAGR